MHNMCLQVAEAIDGWQAASDCEALYLQHKGYLSLDKQFHMQIAWLAMVQDSFNAAPSKVARACAHIVTVAQPQPRLHAALQQQHRVFLPHY